MTELTREQAIKLYDSEWWKNCSDREIVGFQLFTRRLCLPFSEFHRAVEAVLGRPVRIHEFGSNGKLKEEFLGEKPTPTFEEIMSLIPKEKLVLVFATSEKAGGSER